MKPVIHVDALTKRFTQRQKRGRVWRERVDVHAVDGIGFDVTPGETVGFIGPNGAGKSTTIKMLTGILAPTAGTVTVAGFVPIKQRVDLARRIGVVFGQRSQLWWDLPLSESFDLLRHLYDVEAARHGRRLRDCIELLDLSPFLRTPVRQLSLGQRMRGELTAALLHDPDVLFLDEPTIGLDLVSKHRVRQFLLERNVIARTTVFLTTHDLADVERLCERLIVVDRGKVRFDGALEALRERFGGERTLVVDIIEPRPPLELRHATVVKIEGTRQWLRFQRDAISASDLISAVSSQCELRDLTIEEPAIEDIVTGLAASVEGA